MRLKKIQPLRDDAKPHMQKQLFLVNLFNDQINKESQPGRKLSLPWICKRKKEVKKPTWSTSTKARQLRRSCR
jgi:hypothetical protein